jgi:hypothetical protein
MDGTGLTAFFWVHEPVDSNFKNYHWTLGNGKRSFGESTHFTYTKPGTYKVTLRAIDYDGKAHVSNKIFIDVPHPTTFYTGTQQFVTLDDQNDPLWLDGPITSVNGYDEISTIPFRLIGEQNGKYKYQATDTGYFNLTTRGENHSTQVFVFCESHPLQTRGPRGHQLVPNPIQHRHGFQLRTFGGLNGYRLVQRPLRQHTSDTGQHRLERRRGNQFWRTLQHHERLRNPSEIYPHLHPSGHPGHH